MAKKMTIEDLAHITKAGFDDLTFKMDYGFAQQQKRLDEHDKKIDELKHEVAQNGDAVARLTQRFDVESAANQVAHKRIEGRLDKVEVKLDKVEWRLDKVEVKLDKVDTRLVRIESHLQMEPMPI